MQDKQSNLIITIVSIVLALGAATALFFTKREPVAPPAAPKATLGEPAVAAAEVVYTTSLGGGAGTGAPGGFGGPPGGFGGPPGGFGGPPPGGMPGRAGRPTPGAVSGGGGKLDSGSM